MVWLTYIAAGRKQKYQVGSKSNGKLIIFDKRNTPGISKLPCIGKYIISEDTDTVRWMA